MFGVELEFRLEQLGHLDRVHDGREEEDHGVGGRGNEDGNVSDEGQGMVKLGEFEGGRVDASNAEILMLEGGGGVHVGANVSCFGAEEDVEDELDGVGLETHLLVVIPLGRLRHRCIQ